MSLIFRKSRSSQFKASFTDAVKVIDNARSIVRFVLGSVALSRQRKMISTSIFRLLHQKAVLHSPERMTLMLVAVY